MQSTLALFKPFADLVARSLEMIGITVIVLGVLYATVAMARDRKADPGNTYRNYRSRLGRSILLGLEFLVAADIIGTVAVEPSILSVAVLAVVVVIRTFLSFSLEVEINGHWPWEGSRETESKNM